MTRVRNVAPAVPGAAQIATRSSIPTCVDTSLIAVAASVLDHCVPASPSAATAPWNGGLANRLREAAGPDGHRDASRSPTTPPAPTPGRLERDELAATIDRLMNPERPGLLRQLNAALVYETVQALRRENTRWAREPLGAASRRLWEHLYLCIPLTSIVVTSDATRQ
ncbi:hypothetical protein [Kitasatospora sp. NPDC002965]|uniref:hypothetical protein n=1 Tax=Kitasatospora sp. NPDC002965 TaxID=3154775 RepID=UPI0033BC92A7